MIELDDDTQANLEMLALEKQLPVEDMLAHIVSTYMVLRVCVKE